MGIPSQSSGLLLAIGIGQAAWESLSANHTGRVIGVTSRGIFVLLPPQRIVYVSLEQYRSPLTINLDCSVEQFCDVKAGEPVAFSATRMVFPAAEIDISLSAERVWQCPLPARPAHPHAEQVSALQSIIEAVLVRQSSTEFTGLLPRLAGLPVESPQSAEQAMLLERLTELRTAVRAGNDPLAAAGLISWLGQGRGLTPAGDDIVIGLLLMLNRWHTRHDWTPVNRAVIEAAYRVTTTISANLIECAASGQGDERLLTVADSIAIGLASIDECVECVLSWGSSSGIDALIGMALASF